MKPFLRDLKLLSALPVRRSSMQVFEYPFDLQLLTASRLYRESRKQFLAIGGRFAPRLSSTMRSLSAADLFADEIDYTPAASELTWLHERSSDVYDLPAEIGAIEHYSTISLFHEQNHRILWRSLPAAPPEQYDLIRYLNFAESLVVMLDLALADELGPRLAPAFERMKVIYRVGRRPAKAVQVDYLIACCVATYFVLELTNPEDILKAVNYVLASSRSLNRAAVTRALDINELFTRVTNPQWQERSWQDARSKLRRLQGSGSAFLPREAVDLDNTAISIIHSVLKQFRLK